MLTIQVLVSGRLGDILSHDVMLFVNCFSPVSPFARQIRQFRPHLIRGSLVNHRVVSVSAGPHYSLAVTAHGHVFAWGLVYYSGPAPWSGAEQQLYEGDATDEASKKYRDEVTLSALRCDSWCRQGTLSMSIRGSSRGVPERGFTCILAFGPL